MNRLHRTAADSRRVTARRLSEEKQGMRTRLSTRSVTNLDFLTLDFRRMLAGNVSVSTLAGDLQVIGDSADNEVLVYQTLAGPVRVAGLGDTTVNGQRVVEFPAVADDMMLAFPQGGEDHVTISGRLNVPDSLTAWMQGGSITLDGTRGRVSVGGNAWLNAGAVGDVKLLNEVWVGGNLDVRAGGDVQMVAGQARKMPFSPAQFPTSLQIDNPLFPLVPGTTYLYKAIETDPDTGEVVHETVRVDVLDQTRLVGGVEARVVQDRVWKNGRLIEDTFDWYAQDSSGSVWYLGEIATNYNYDEDGNLLGTDNGGSWETGVDGAQPGIQMPASPRVGDRYYQEFRPRVAIDQGDVLATGLTRNTNIGPFSGVVQTRDWTVLEPDSVEHKFYARGLGNIGTEKLDYHTGEVIASTRLVSVMLNGAPVMQITNPAAFAGSSQIGRGTGFLRVAGTADIRNAASILLDGNRLIGGGNLQAEAELGFRDCWFASAVEGRADGNISLQQSYASRGVYFSGDSDLSVRASTLRDEFEVELDDGDNQVLILAAWLMELQIDGGGGDNLLDLDEDSWVGELDLTRIDQA
jgi:hypothetical protein